MRTVLNETNIDAKALASIGSYHSETIKEVMDAVASNKVVVVGMSQNPFVGKARKALEEKKIQFKYLEYGSYLSMWKPRLAIKLWSGWPTFPQVFVGGKLIGGFKDLEAKIKSGEIK